MIECDYSTDLARPVREVLDELHRLRRCDAESAKTIRTVRADNAHLHEQVRKLDEENERLQESIADSVPGSAYAEMSAEREKFASRCEDLEKRNKQLGDESQGLVSRNIYDEICARNAKLREKVAELSEDGMRSAAGWSEAVHTLNQIRDALADYEES